MRLPSQMYEHTGSSPEVVTFPSTATALDNFPETEVSAGRTAETPAVPKHSWQLPMVIAAVLVPMAGIAASSAIAWRRLNPVVKTPSATALRVDGRGFAADPDPSAGVIAVNAHSEDRPEQVAAIEAEPVGPEGTLSELPVKPVTVPVQISPVTVATISDDEPNGASASTAAVEPSALADASTSMLTASNRVAAADVTLPIPPTAITPPPPTSTAPDVVATSEATETANRAAVGVSEQSAVRVVLDRYVNAYEALDVKATEAVWPSVDTKALSRAFTRLEAQQIDFSDCQISVTANRATAACNGTAQFVPKVGKKTPHLDFREWTFELIGADGQWRIVRVNVQ